MERKKKMTKTLISDSLKQLMSEKPFEKITIKMITDEAGVIRPTFYNYFCDKYEVLEWIFEDEVIDKVRAMFEQKMYTEGIKLLFVCMKNDGSFYRKAFEVTGQNSFEEILHHKLYELLLSSLDSQYIEKVKKNPLMTKEMLSRYYASSMVIVLREWIMDYHFAGSVEDVLDAYEYIVSHSFKDFLKNE